MPVGNGGKFTKEAGEIYDLVHSMQAVRAHPPPSPHTLNSRPSHF
jgi:hypothetical protein